MIDHVSLHVRDFAKSKAFYLKALEPLGLGLEVDYEGAVAGFGAEGLTYLWVLKPKATFWTADHKAGASPTHIAFRADDRKQVDAFYKAAVAAGGKDNGKPGVRPYHDNYYGAFVIDPDGNNVEAVCHFGEDDEADDEE